MKGSIRSRTKELKFERFFSVGKIIAHCQFFKQDLIPLHINILLKTLTYSWLYFITAQCLRKKNEPVTAWADEMVKCPALEYIHTVNQQLPLHLLQPTHEIHIICWDSVHLLQPTHEIHFIYWDSVQCAPTNPWDSYYLLGQRAPAKAETTMKNFIMDNW